MSATLVLPVCSVSPQGGGQCSYVPADEGTLPDLHVYERGEYKNYTYTATPTAGARFVGFDVTVAGFSRQNPEAPEEQYILTTRYAGVAVGGSWQYQPDISNWRGGGPGGVWYNSGYAIWHEIRAIGGSWIQNLGITSIQVVAVFDVPRIPTHLLVNSSTMESPSKLVYNPATNLLVADY